MDAVFLSRLQFALATMFHFIFVPILLAYQIWTYKVFSHSVGPEDLSYEEGS